MIRLSAVMIVTMILLTGTLCVGEASSLPENLTLGLTYRSSYDSNILKYSSLDRVRFQDGTERYVSPTQTLDDLHNDIKVSIGYGFNLWRETKFEATGKFSGYLINSVKNFGWASLTLRQNLPWSLRLSANYFYEPRYFIRDYSDVHTSERQHCEFGLSQWKGELRHRPSDAWDVMVIGRIKQYAYNEYFTEYDSDLIEIGAMGVYRHGSFRYEVGYSLSVNDNIGFSSTDRLPPGSMDDEDSEIGQGDYQTDNYTLAVRYNFRLAKKRTYVQLKTSLGDRYYSTDRDPSIDPMHHGRRDVTTSTELSGS
ncbi:MAG: hypothetical protein P9M15_03730, partial [Candidatus Electryoneaceae bacterium]|nr:hypothetical protein [Candidatus Electryoneaceae bacterium]